MSEQRWLSLDGICSRLGMVKSHVLWLAEHDHLAVIWGRQGRRRKDARFLDPTPEYVAKLKRAEALYGRTYPLPIDIDLIPLLSLREVAEIMGWTLKATRHRQTSKMLPPHVKVGGYYLYTAADVRQMLWKRCGRKLARQRAPFLIPEMVEWFLRRQAEMNGLIPTDAEFMEDDRTKKRLAYILKLPLEQQQAATRDLLEKMGMVKRIVSTLQS